jgi:hypothetical protein
MRLDGHDPNLNRRNNPESEIEFSFKLEIMAGSRISVFNAT